MKNEKEAVQKKLAIAKAKLSDTSAEMGRLGALIAPLNESLEAVNAENNYLQARIAKLTKMLEGM